MWKEEEPKDLVGARWAWEGELKVQRQEVEEAHQRAFGAQEEVQWRTECQQSGWTTLGLVPLVRLCSTMVRPVPLEGNPRMKKRKMKRKEEV